MKKNKENKKSNQGIYFLIFVILLYISLFLFHPEKTQQALGASLDLFIKIVPIIFLIILFMGIMNYFVKPKTILKYVGKSSGAKGWTLAIFAGILSHGSIYVWYPLLGDLLRQGMRNGLIGVFLYNRAVKIPLLPLMVCYFGVLFVVVLLIYMIIASIAEGKIIEMLMKKSRIQ